MYYAAFCQRSVGYDAQGYQRKDTKEASHGSLPSGEALILGTIPSGLYCDKYRQNSTLRVVKDCFPPGDRLKCPTRRTPTVAATLKRLIVASAIAVFAPSSVYAHGIAGNRFFVGTLTFDDPSVADEAIVPNLNHAVQGGSAVDNRFDWSFTRLLTPVLQVQVDSGWIHRNWSTARTSGFATTDVGIKSEIYRNNQHEMLVSTGILWGIGHSGAQGVGADEPNSIQPGVFFGKGFGDLPDGLAWLRPFAVTGAFVDELPFGSTTTVLGISTPSGKLQSTFVPVVETLHWGLSLQYSTYYLTSRFTGGPPKDEPLNQLLPLVEFSFDTPRGQNTVATMNPGLAYVAVAWQLAAEVILPLNREAGNRTGFRAQLLFFLDDLIPKLFDKPLLSDKPERSLIAWH
jgi:hypothetical protein